MARQKFEKGSSEWNLFMDFWAIAQEFAVPEKTDAFWESFINKATGYSNKYKDFDERLAQDIMMAWHTHLERIQDGNTK